MKVVLGQESFARVVQIIKSHGKEIIADRINRHKIKVTGRDSDFNTYRPEDGKIVLSRTKGLFKKESIIEEVDALAVLWLQNEKLENVALHTSKCDDLIKTLYNCKFADMTKEVQLETCEADFLSRILHQYREV